MTANVRVYLPEVRREHIGCADDTSVRYGLSYGLLTPHKAGAYLTSTDGRCASVVSIDGTIETGEEYLLPKKVIAPKSEKNKAVVLNGFWQGVKKNAPEEQELRYPIIESVMPDIPKNCESDYVVVSLNAQALANIAGAISEDSKGVIRLFVPKNQQSCNDHAMRVVGKNGIGVIMPVAFDSPASEIKKYNKFRDDFDKARQVVRKDLKDINGKVR